MPLSASRLGTAIGDGMVAAMGVTDATAAKSFRDMGQAIADAVILELTTNAIVSPTGAIPMNVVIGAPGPSPVLGTGKLT